jgi:hypothetical protein
MTMPLLRPSGTRTVILSFRRSDCCTGICYKYFLYNPLVNVSILISFCIRSAFNSLPTVKITGILVFVIFVAPEDETRSINIVLLYRYYRYCYSDTCKFFFITYGYQYQVY